MQRKCQTGDREAGEGQAWAGTFVNERLNKAVLVYYRVIHNMSVSGTLCPTTHSYWFGDCAAVKTSVFALLRLPSTTWTETKVLRRAFSEPIEKIYGEGASPMRLGIQGGDSIAFISFGPFFGPIFGPLFSPFFEIAY